MINVLVTSVGGGVGQSVLDSISHLTSSYKIIGLDLSDTVLARNQCDEFFISPRINDDSYLKFLLDICKEKNINILIPGNDGELDLLSRNVDLFESYGTTVVVSPTKIVASSRNKYNWYKDYSDIINIVPTALYDVFISEPEKYPEISFPMIAKPASGSASSGIKIFLNVDELRRDRIPSNESKNYVVQPYLMPAEDDPDYAALEKAVHQKRLLQLSEISCQIVFNNSSEIMGIFVSKNSLKNGVPVTIEPLTDEGIISAIREIGNKLKKEGVVGPVNIQGRLTSNGLVFFEMNLRFTGITGNRSQFGFNEVSAVIDSFVNAEDSKINLSFNSSRVGARQVACTTSYPLASRKVKNILITGGGSWAAQNFVNYIKNNKKNLNVNVTLSSRKPELTQQAFLDNNLTNDVTFIGVSERELVKAIGLSDVVINFASARPPHGAFQIHQSTMFNLSLADLIKKCNPGLVLNMSSQSVYEDDSKCHSEASPINASSPYAISKLTVEHAFSSVSKFTRGTDVVSLRLGRLWGGQLDTDHSQLPYRILDAILGGGDCTIDNPKNSLSLLDVDDLSEAILRMISLWESGGSLPSTINLGGINTSLEELVSSLETIVDSNEVSIASLYTSESVKEPSFFTVSSALAKELDLLPETDLSKTWAKLLKSYHNTNN